MRHIELLKEAESLLLMAPGGHQHITDLLHSHRRALEGAIDEAGDALGGDSNDAEHDALVSLMEALGETLPDDEAAKQLDDTHSGKGKR